MSKSNVHGLMSVSDQKQSDNEDPSPTIIKRKVVVVTGFGGDEEVSQRRSILDVMRVKYIVERKCPVTPQAGSKEFRLRYEVDVFRAPTGAIADDALAAIDSAHILIALITEQNVNVIYEIAVRNLLHDEYLILLNAEHEKSLPIYLRNMAHIKYTPSRIGDKEKELNKVMNSIADLSEPFLSWAHLDQIPGQLADAIDQQDQRLVSALNQALQSLEDGPPQRPSFLRNLVKDLDPGRMLQSWTPFSPYSVLRIRWKGRSGPQQTYLEADMVEPPVVYSASADYLTIFALPGGLDDPDGPDAITIGRLVAQVKRYMRAEDLEQFKIDQERATQLVVFENRFAAAEVPLKFTGQHPFHAGKAFLPHLVARRVVGDTASPHAMFILVTFIEQKTHKQGSQGDGKKRK